VLKLIFMVLIVMCSSGVLILVDHARIGIGHIGFQVGETKMWATSLLILCIAVAFGGISFTMLDTGEKLAVIIAKHDSEIADLEAKLEQLVGKSEKP
ncbi:MAG TPA: hypothetical protein VGZ48_07300, partial [Candidatus Acidoferrales bacterium]|nr:hypothetical protein [Candidatus Acidoferrales bacterium]